MKNSEYYTLPLWRGGERIGHISVHERDYEIFRTLCLEANGHIMPVKTHIIGSTHYMSDGTRVERGEGEDLAGFDLETVSEDVYTAFNTFGGSHE